MTGPSGDMPSPLGEPEPFGAVKDLSLVSTSGIATDPGIPSSDQEQFGHVSDLSLISTNTETAAKDALASARQKALASFDDGGDTEAMVRKDVQGNLRGRMPAPPAEGDADLPAVVQTADLPAVSSKNKRPEVRRPGQVGPTQSGSSAMIGKPPPPVAPQPFGPMAKVESEPGPASRTAAMPRPARSAPAPKTTPSPARPPAPPPVTTAPMPARSAPPAAHPLNTTAPLEQRSPVAATQMSPPFAPPQAPPPIPQAYPSSPPPQAYPSAPPGQTFGSQPPMGCTRARRSRRSSARSRPLRRTPTRTGSAAAATNR